MLAEQVKYLMNACRNVEKLAKPMLDFKSGHGEDELTIHLVREKPKDFEELKDQFDLDDVKNKSKPQKSVSNHSMFFFRAMYNP
jgi:hypothetical protein